MVEPNDWRGVAIQLEAHQKYVESWLDWHRKLVFVILGLLGTILAAILGSLWQIDDVKVLASVTADRVARIEGEVEKLRKQDAEILAVLGRIDRSLPQRVYVDRAYTPSPERAAIELRLTPDFTAGEARLVRDRIGAIPRTMEPGDVTRGDKVDLTETKPFPDDLIAKIPKLRGLRFKVDVNNAIVLVDEDTGLVVEIL